MSILDLKHSNEILVRICCFGTFVTYSWWSVWVFCGNDLAWNSNVLFAGCNPEAWRIHTVRINQTFFCFLQGGTWFIYFFSETWFAICDSVRQVQHDLVWFIQSLSVSSHLSCKVRLIPCTCLAAALESISLMPVKCSKNQWNANHGCLSFRGFD